MDGMNLEVWFPQQDQVSVFLESSVVDPDEERFYETSLFALFATRQIANLRGDWVATTLAETLAHIDVDHGADDVRGKLGHVHVVAPSNSRGRKGFIAQLRPEKRGWFKMNPRGFGLMGKGVQYYAPTSTLALLSFLLDRRSDDREFQLALAMTAKVVGRAGMDDAIGITSSAPIAMSAAATGWEFARDDAQEAEDDEDPVRDIGNETQLRAIAVGQRLAEQYGVDLIELSNHIVEEIAAARPADSDPGTRWAFPGDVLRRMCAVDFAVASSLSDPRLDEAFTLSGSEVVDEVAMASLGNVALTVLDDHGLTPAVDALLLLITTDDFSSAI